MPFPPNPPAPSLRSALTLRPSAFDDQGSTTSMTTKTIRELAGRAALWRQPSQLRKDYELVTGDETVATLRWRKNIGTSAVARSPDGTWSFKALGFLNPSISIRLPNSEYDFATFRPRNPGDGTLTAMAEQRFEWRCVSFWQNAWAFFNSEGERLLLFRPEGAFPKINGAVEIDPKAAAHQEVGYMIVLGWYILVLMAEDAVVGRTGMA